MSEFYLPYQFIPATGEVKRDKGTTKTATIDLLEIRDGSGDHHNSRHDLWLNETLHGRIKCRMYLETPLVVGAKHELIGPKPEPGRKDKRPQKVIPYKYKGQYAIPANSLRGMVASIAEAISQSALRVLENKSLSICDYDNRELHSVGETFDYFNPDLLPLGEHRRQHGTKNSNGQPLLTPAEILFGVVEEGKGEDESAIALKSRLIFHDALSDKDIKIAENAVTLKILDTPKPPSPAMYFQNKTNPKYFISKMELETARHQPRGRKVYLHHLQTDIDNQNWETGDKNKLSHLKMKCFPIKSGQDFYFHIDFENLTSAELKLLETSLFPDLNFRHRLGLGKPLGLGSIAVTVENIQFHTPKERYGLSAIQPNNCHTEPTSYDSNDTTLIDEQTLKAVITVGKRGTNGQTHLKEGIPVRYPFVNTPEEEEKLYQWYAENECLGPNGQGQVLGIVKSDTTLPTLSTHDDPQRFRAEYIDPADDIPPNFICRADEQVSSANQWVRASIAEIDQHEFNDLDQTTIGSHLTGKALAKKWDELPQSTPDETQLKIEVKKLILASVEKRNLMLHRLAKKRYNN